MKTKRVCAGLGNIILDLDLMAVSKLPNALRIRGAVGDSENCWAENGYRFNFLLKLGAPTSLRGYRQPGRFASGIYDQEFKL